MKAIHLGNTMNAAHVAQSHDAREPEPRSSLRRSLSPDPHPPNASALYAWTYEHLLFPVWQRVVRGRSIFDRLADLESSQWLPREELDAFQLASLKAILEHAGTHVPYYKELFAKVHFDPRGVTSRRDLAELPLLTREIIHERYDDLLDPAHAGLTIKKGTSGTTGRPLKFEYCNDSETWRQAIRLRGYKWAGYRLGLPTLHYWAQGAILPKGVQAAKIALDRALRREVYVDAIHQDDESMVAAVDTINKLQPHVIIGYTQATAIFARFVIENGLRAWGDIPVICGAEGLLPADRAAVDEAFGPAFETYGSRETMLIGAECHAHDGMHVSEENLVVEIARDDGRPLEDGESGDVVVTDLHNRAMPFIRYQNGDVGVMSPAERCPCGRTLRRLARVDGRRCDTLHDTHGRPIPGMLFIALFANRQEMVSQFQIVQRASGKVLLKVVKGRDFDERAFADTIRRFRGYLRDVPFVVEFCGAIAASASGKRRPILVETDEDRESEG